MRCQDIMRRPIRCTHPGEAVQSAARTMRDANIGFLPVCDDDGRLLGVITDRDIAIRVCADGRGGEKVAVAEVMTVAAVACQPHEDISRATELMTHYRKSRILVVDAGGRVMGVISLSDVARIDALAAARALAQVAAREAVLDQHGTVEEAHH
jgi:CBS domain-containing protein